MPDKVENNASMKPVIEPVADASSEVISTPEERRRDAMRKLGKLAAYTTPVILGILSSDAWSEYG